MNDLTLLIATTLSTLLLACNESPVASYDITPPFPPVGIKSVSLDHAVELEWIENQEPDLVGYNVYFCSSYNGHYERIGSTEKARYIDRGAVNGETYFYAITALDFAGNESELSKDVVYDTPRPEGRNIVLMDKYIDPFHSGYDFSNYSLTHFDTNNTDFYVEYASSKIPYLVVWEDSDIQDMGYTNSIDEISAAPEAGWTPTKDAQAITGHTYVIWTFDNHFAKIRITSVSQMAITFDWAYQVAQGNPELFRQVTTGLSKAVRQRTAIRKK